MNKIKNIIFDLGGVVIDLDRQRAIEALGNLGIPDVSRLLDDYEQKGVFLDLETGKKSCAEVYDELISLSADKITATQIRDAFEQFLIAIPPKRLKSIRELRKKGYKLFVLSNTNPIMYNHWIDNAFRQEGLSINDYFDGITVSFQERTCKPDPEIFKRLVERYGLDPKETLMLDDSAANCKGAESIGLHAIRIKEQGADSFESVCSRLAENSEI